MRQLASISLIIITRFDCTNDRCKTIANAQNLESSGADPSPSHPTIFYIRHLSSGALVRDGVSMGELGWVLRNRGGLLPAVPGGAACPVRSPQTPRVAIPNRSTSQHHAASANSSAKVRDLLRGFSGFRNSPLDPETGFRFKLPAWVLLPFQTQISPVRVFRKNQFQLLFPPPAFDLDFPHSGADEARMLFIPDQHVELIPRGEAVRVEFVLVLERALGQVAGEPGIKAARLVRHDVNPEGLHACARIVRHPEDPRSRFLGLTEARGRLQQPQRFGLGMARRCF
jgi:hypothetical protein